MKRFASHRLYIPHLDLLLKNHVVEVDETDGTAVGYYPLIEEIPFTEWLNGLIVLSFSEPCISADSASCISDDGSVVLYVDLENKENKIRSVISQETDMTPLTLKVYYVTMFNVSEMSFCPNSRVVRLF